MPQTYLSVRLVLVMSQDLGSNNDRLRLSATTSRSSLRWLFYMAKGKAWLFKAKRYSPFPFRDMAR